MTRGSVLGAALTCSLLILAGAASAKDWKTVVIGMEGAYDPYNLTDPSGKIVGFEPDVAMDVCARMKVECKIIAQDWDGMIPGLEAGKFDVIMDGMSIGVGREVYIVPLSSVIESFLVQPGMLKTIGGSGRVVEVRNEFMPVLELERVFDVPRSGAANASAIMVVVEADGGRVALLVDELLGQQQVVVKNLEANYRRVEGVSGATIMGDGRVALILDIASMVRRSRH